MKIVNHLLVRDDGTPYAFERSPNVSSGELQPKYLVMHYTAGSSARESINWLKNPQAKASAHIVIDRDGTITQMVPFNKVAWHAGKSQWKGIDGLNRHSIGIELDNPGRLTKASDGTWRAAFGGRYPEQDVVVATHKNETSPSGWARYPQAQMDAARELAKLLVATYGLREVIGHEDISPGRKQDPGPAFPMAEFAAQTMAGAAAALNDGATHAATANLKVRGGPGPENAEVPGSPIANGTRVVVLEGQGDWRRIRVPSRGMEGWAHGGYLAAIPGAVPPTAVPAQPAAPEVRPVPPPHDPPLAGDGATHAATANLKVRGGPGQQNAEVPGSPIPNGTRVVVHGASGDWRQVRVPSRGMDGWVHGGYLRELTPAERQPAATPVGP